MVKIMVHMVWMVNMCYTKGVDVVHISGRDGEYVLY